MKAIVTITMVMLVCAALPVAAQTLTVAGTQVHVREGALLTVNGDVEQTDGEVRVYDNARVEIRGDARIVRGTWHLLDDAYMMIRQDLVIEINAVCWRYRPGGLDVEGGITNRGELTNEGEISIGRP